MNAIKAVLILIFVMLFNVSLSGQFLEKKEAGRSFFFDAICYKSRENAELNSRLDIFVLIPYQALQFEENNKIFGAYFNLIIEIYDSSGKKIVNEMIKQKVTEEDYYIAQGGTGKFDRIIKHFFLNAGKYEINIQLKDLISKQNYKKSRQVIIINFEKYTFSLSGLMLVSSIEEKEGKYKITPHIDDNIGILENGFFIFHEVYNQKDYKEVDFVYQLINKNDKIVMTSKKYRKILNANNSHNFVSQIYKKINLPDELEYGVYTLRLIALKPDDKLDYNKDDYLAITERTVKYYKTISGNILQDIDEAIKYLRYIADQSDIEYIAAGATKSEKQKRLEKYWESIDPSPNTERNEAFEEYYGRIEYANANYNTYTKGWLSDMGKVFIIYGKPDYIDNSNSYGARTSYIKWVYRGREFLFIDRNGLGDYRLAISSYITDKYKYQN